MELEKILDELVIIWDHTGIDCIPVSNWTMEAKEIRELQAMLIKSSSKCHHVRLFSATTNHL